MKLETVLKHMNRIRLNGHGIKAVEVSKHEKVVLMEGAAFYRQFPDHKTEHGTHQKYVMCQGVRVLTYDPDPNGDEADTTPLSGIGQLIEDFPKVRKVVTP